MSYIILVGLYFNVSVEPDLCAVPKPQTHETAMLLKSAFERVYGHLNRLFYSIYAHIMPSYVPPQPFYACQTIRSRWISGETRGYNTPDGIQGGSVRV